MAISPPEGNQTFFKESFPTLQDPRRTIKGNLIYSLGEILFLTISAVICGCNTWASIAEYGRLKQDWFRKFYPYKKMPSHDAISDLSCALEPKKFAECFINRVNGIATKEESGVVAIDGKTVGGPRRRATNSRCTSSAHFVPRTGSAWGGVRQTKKATK